MHGIYTVYLLYSFSVPYVYSFHVLEPLTIKCVIRMAITSTTGVEGKLISFQEELEATYNFSCINKFA